MVAGRLMAGELKSAENSALVNKLSWSAARVFGDQMRIRQKKQNENQIIKDEMGNLYAQLAS